MEWGAHRERQPALRVQVVAGVGERGAHTHAGTSAIWLTTRCSRGGIRHTAVLQSILALSTCDTQTPRTTRGSSSDGAAVGLSGAICCIKGTHLPCSQQAAITPEQVLLEVL